MLDLCMHIPCRPSARPTPHCFISWCFVFVEGGCPQTCKIIAEQLPVFLFVCMCISKWGIPRTGYSLPGRDRLGVWLEGRVVDASPPSASASVPEMAQNEPQSKEKHIFPEIAHVTKFQKQGPKNKPRQGNTSLGAARPPPPACRP